MAVMNVIVGVSTSSKETTKQSKNKKARPIVLQKQVRASKRNLRTKRNAGLMDDSIKSVNRTVEMAPSPMEYGNIKQKLLFMTALGLTPKSTSKIMPPFVKLERLDDTPKSSSKCTSNTKYPPIISRFNDDGYSSASSVVTFEPSRLNKQDENKGQLPEYIELDDDELDLELLICPLDIPELFQDFFSKKSPHTTNNTNKNHNTQYSKSNNNHNHVDSLDRNNNNKHKRSMQQTTIDTYLIKPRKNSPEIPLIDLTEDDDNISCQDGSLEDIKRTLMSFGTLLKSVE